MGKKEEEKRERCQRLWEEKLLPSPSSSSLNSFLPRSSSTVERVRNRTEEEGNRTFGKERERANVVVVVVT